MTLDSPPPRWAAVSWTGVAGRALLRAAPATPLGTQICSPPRRQEPHLDMGTPQKRDLSVLRQGGRLLLRHLPARPRPPEATWCPCRLRRGTAPPRLPPSARAQGVVPLLCCHPHLLQPPSCEWGGLSHLPTSHSRGWRGGLLGGGASDSSQVVAPGRAAGSPPGTGWQIQVVLTKLFIAAVLTLLGWGP